TETRMPPVINSPNPTLSASLTHLKLRCTFILQAPCYDIHATKDAIPQIATPFTVKKSVVDWK
ncbi:MAG: hypothetical protein WAM60_25990, partial [Candidatus Promineifilaceae bacterium]